MAGELTLTIEVTTGHCLGGEGNDVYPGRILVAPRDLSIADARKKVRMGYARIVPNTREIVTHQDPAVESRDPVTEPVKQLRRGRPVGRREASG